MIVLPGDKFFDFTISKMCCAAARSKKKLMTMVKTIQASEPIAEATRPATPSPQLTNPISFWNPFVTHPIFFAVDLARTVCMKPLVMNMMPAGRKNIQANAFSLKVGSPAPHGVVQFSRAKIQAKTSVSGTNRIPMPGI